MVSRQALIGKVQGWHARNPQVFGGVSLRVAIDGDLEDAGLPPLTTSEADGIPHIDLKPDPRSKNTKNYTGQRPVGGLVRASKDYDAAVADEREKFFDGLPTPRPASSPEESTTPAPTAALSAAAGVDENGPPPPPGMRWRAGVSAELRGRLAAARAARHGHGLYLAGERTA